MGVLLKGKTIEEVFELLQELKSVSAVAKEIGVTNGAVYNFRSEHHKAFKRLKAESEAKENEVNISNKAEDTKEVHDNQQDSDLATVTISKVAILEKTIKSLKNKVKQLKSEKNQLHGRINLLEDEIKTINNEKSDLKTEYEFLTHDYEKLNEIKESYKNQLDALSVESNNILVEAKKYRELSTEYQDKLAILSERQSEHTNLNKNEAEQLRKELAFFKEHALIYYEKANEVS